MPRCFAVMGNPIAHSLSPFIHQQFALQTGIDLAYEKMLVPQDAFAGYVADFFKNGGQGLNITAPFKQEACALAHHTTTRCREAGAANTLWMQEQTLHADNTDGIGLIRDLGRYVNLNKQRVLLLGAGGATRGIIPALLKASIASLTLLNRTVSKAKALQRDFPSITILAQPENVESFDLIINATSAPLLPNAWLEKLSQQNSASAFYYDLMYSLHEPRLFIQWAQQQAFHVADGLGMLVEQAAESFFVWHGVMPNTESVLSLLRG